MICSLVSGRMAALARLLRAGNVPQSIADDVGRRKLAVQYIHRELWEADEANLIDEEDMHVFGLRPMTDPLELVLCNACKKPIKASNYAAHAELCKALSCTEEVALELNNGRGHKKPPRKERKKLLTACSNQATSVALQDTFKSPPAVDIAASALHRKEQTEKIPFAEAKRNPLGRDGILVMDDGSRISPGNIDCPDGAKPRPAKRFKMVRANGLQVTDHHFESTNGVTKSSSATTQDAILRADLGSENQRRSSAGSEKASDHVVDYGLPWRERGLLTKDVPVPLATKIYYSQRNNRLRSSLSHLYFAASSNEHSSEVASTKLHSNGDPIQNPAPNRLEPEQIADQQDKMGEHSLYSGQQPDQLLAQCSELLLGESGGFPPAMNKPTFFPVNNVLKPQTSIGITRSNYISNSYHFASNSGEPLGSMQQPEESMSIV